MSLKRPEKHGIADHESETGSAKKSRSRRSGDKIDPENKYDIINLQDLSDGEESDIEDLVFGSKKDDSDDDYSGIGGKIVTFSDASDGEADEVLEQLVFGSSKKKMESLQDEQLGFFIDKTSGDVVEKAGPAWVDDDDEEAGIAADDIEPRGMGNMKFQPLMKGNRKAEFEKAIGEAPSWSVLPEVADNDKQSELLNTNFKYTTDSDRLPRGVLDFHSCENVNKQQPTKGPLDVCEFHKTAQIALTAGRDCRLNLFQVDGKNNPKIHSFFMERFPIKCAHFLASGEEIVMTSQPHYFYSYDLISGQITQVQYIKGVNDKKLRKFCVSPDKKHLLFLSRYGHMHLVSAKTKELVKTVKANGTIEKVVFQKQGQEFMAFGEEGVVTIWDVRSQSCVHSFTDEGCTYGTSLAVSPNGQFVACGSRSGIVNVYDNQCFSNENPKPIKTFKNLQFSTNRLEFNSTSEILGMSSADVDNAVRLIHVPSMTVFSNFPGLKIKYLKMIKSMEFSPNGGYMMLGNQIGKGNPEFLAKMKTQIKCVICRENFSKYKCPVCKIEYCSVKCYKEHKEVGCTQPREREPPKAPPNKTSDEIILGEDESDRLQPKLLERLKDSGALKDLLRNPHLRRLITELDSSDHKEELVGKLMKEPIFVEFADECLRSIGGEDK